jgi:predicted metal-dependent hydrolase
LDKIVLGGTELSIKVIYKDNRNTYLRIKPNRSLLVTTNKRTSESAILAFIKHNEPKILAKLDHMTAGLPIIGDTFSYFGTTLKAIHAPLLSTSWKFNGETFYYRDSSKRINHLKEFYKQETLRATNDLIIRWEPVLRSTIDLKQISLKSQWMKSRFGSCQYQKRIINMNSALACFDPIYLEAIFLHEIVHIKVSNHGSDFYKLLLSLSPNYRSLRRELGRLFKMIEV